MPERRVYGYYVGVDDYTSYPRLQCCSNDAKELSRLWGEKISHERLRVAHSESGSDPDPSLATLRGFLVELESAAMTDDDLAMFYFAGHGYSQDGRDYLVACDAVRGDPTSALSTDDVIAALRQSGAGTGVLIIDACRVRVERDGGIFGQQTFELARRNGVVVFFGCGPDEVSQELPSIGHGVFTGALIDALENLQRRTPLDIDGFTRARVAELCEQHKLGKQLPYTAVMPLQKTALDLLTGEVHRFGSRDSRQCILLVGPSNAGKTTVGQLLSSTLGFVHIEMSSFGWQRLNARGDYKGSLQDFMEEEVWQQGDRAALARDVLAAHGALDAAERLVICGARTVEEIELFRDQGWECHTLFLFASASTRFDRFCLSGDRTRYRLSYREFIAKDMRELSWGLAAACNLPHVELIVNEGTIDKLLPTVLEHLPASIQNLGAK